MSRTKKKSIKPKCRSHQVGKVEKSYSSMVNHKIKITTFICCFFFWEIGVTIGSIIYNYLFTYLNVEELIIKTNYYQTLLSSLPISVIAGLIISTFLFRAKNNFSALRLSCITSVLLSIIGELAGSFIYKQTEFYQNNFTPLILLNATGGLIAGIACWFVYIKLQKYQKNTQQDNKIYLKNFTIYEIIFLSILCFSFILYFSVVFKKPQKIHLEIEDWGKISYYYVKSISKYQKILDCIEEKAPSILGKSDKSVMLRISADVVHALSKNDFAFKWWLGLKDHEKTSSSLEIFNMENIYDENDLLNIYRGYFYQYTNKNKIAWSQKTITKPGIISLSGDDHDFHAIISNDDQATEKGKISILTSVPVKQYITFSKKERDFNGYINLPGFNLLDDDNKRKSISVRTESGLPLILLSNQKIGIFISTPEPKFLETKGFNTSYDFLHPSIEEPIKIKETFHSNPNIPHPLLLLYLGENHEEKGFQIKSTSYNLELHGCDYNFESSGVRTIIGNPHFNILKGNLTLSNKKYTFTSGDELFIGGEDLSLEDAYKGIITIKGQSPHVSLNGVSLSKSLLSAIPNEIINTFFAFLAGLITAWLSVQWSNRRHREDEK